MANISSTKNLTVVAILIAIGTILPIVSPLKFILEPASFTFLSHVAIFLSMFISPRAAVIVSIGTALGFFLGGFPLVVVLRALSHVVFAFIGAFILSTKRTVLLSKVNTFFFAFFISIIHSICELLVVSIFYFNQSLSSLYYSSGFVFSVLTLVGLGTILHSLIDFYITLVILKPISKSPSSKKFFPMYNK